MSRRIMLVTITGCLALASSSGPATAQDRLPVPADLPAAFIPPALHPEGAELVARQLGGGVYALISTKPPVDNGGFVVGERGVLVTDAHINAEMAEKAQAAIREVTDAPILYLVNTNFHGDHTFGNHAFPSETQVVAHRATAERMQAFEHEKQFLLVTVEGDAGVYADAELRLPDLTFDSRMVLDLGGITVELHHFGPGNTPGDVVVHVPSTGTAWTGNLVLGDGIVPFLLEGAPSEYRRTIERFRAELDVRTIIPGHGPPATAAQLDLYLDYLGWLADALAAAKARGLGPEDAAAEVALPERFVPSDPTLRAFVRGLHVFNVSHALRVGLP